MNQMNETVTEAKAEVVSEGPEESLVEALFDVGLAWAEFGVGQGRRALETGAQTLRRVAETLGALQGKLRRGAA